MTSGRQRPAFLTGNVITLSPLEPEDASGAYPEWLNDAETSAGNSHHIFPYTRAEAADFILKNNGSRTALILAIILRDDQSHIGNVALQNINYVSRNAELAILVGDPRCRGRGIGREACRLLLDHGFKALNLHRIYLGTLDSNVGMQRLAQHLGMREEGRRVEAMYKDGIYRDIIEYGLLKRDFQSN